MFDDVFEGLADLIIGKIKEGIWARWIKFIFELVISGGGSFLLTHGAVLLKTHSWMWAFGSAEIAAVLCVIALCRRESTRLLKGMFFVLPAEEAKLGTGLIRCCCI